MRALRTALASALLLILVLGASASDSGQPEELEFRFPLAVVEPPDQRTLVRYRNRPTNFQCDLVEFSTDRLVDLILRIDSGETVVTDSTVTLFPLGRDGVRFVGFYSNTNKEDGAPGPYEWAGRMSDQSYFKASFIISKNKRVSGKIDTPEGMYSMSQSNWSGDQFLCEVDPSVLPRKID